MAAGNILSSSSEHVNIAAPTKEEVRNKMRPAQGHVTVGVFIVCVFFQGYSRTRATHLGAAVFGRPPCGTHYLFISFFRSSQLKPDSFHFIRDALDVVVDRPTCQCSLVG